MASAEVDLDMDDLFGDGQDVDENMEQQQTVEPDMNEEAVGGEGQTQGDKNTSGI